MSKSTASLFLLWLCGSSTFFTCFSPVSTMCHLFYTQLLYSRPQTLPAPCNPLPSLQTETGRERCMLFFFFFFFDSNHQTEVGKWNKALNYMSEIIFTEHRHWNEQENKYVDDMTTGFMLRCDYLLLYWDFLSVIEALDLQPWWLLR